MRRNVLDALLLLAALIGGVFVWHTGRERSRLRVEFERLSRVIGDFPIIDPSRVHVLALETGEPLHFAWRVYLPASYQLIQRSKSGIGRTSGSATSEEFIARVRFREDRDGRLDLYQNFANGSSRGGFGGGALAKVLHGRFDKVLVEQLGKPKLVTIGPDEPMVLLSLKLPADMRDEVLAKMSPAEQARFDPNFFDLSFGPESKTAPSPNVEN